MLAILAKFLKALNSEASPRQIGWAAGLGLLAGLLPFGLLSIGVLFIACIFTVNLSTFLVVWGLSGSLMLLAGEVVESLAWQYGQQSWLLNALAGSEFLQLLHLHHTQVLGALVLGLILLAPVTWLTAKCVMLYRKRIMTFIQKLKIVQVLKATRFAQIYNKIS